MSKFQNYLKTFDITSTLTEEDIDKTLALLQIYGPAVRRTASRIGEMEEECYEGRRQSISDFINLAIDYDRDTDRKRIADRLAEMGHSMQLLSVMEDALVLVKDTPPNGGTYFNILQARYFDVYCTSNEEAYKKARVVLQFNEMDFRHRRALEILRQRPRSMSELVVSAILHYTSCPEVADEHSKEWIASTVKEIITEMISSGELQISAQTPAPETNGSSLAADDLAELGGVMGMFRTKG